MSSVSHFYGYEKMSEKYGDRDRIIGAMKNMHTGSLVTNHGIGQLFNLLFCLGLQSGGYVVLVESTTESSKEVQ